MDQLHKKKGTAEQKEKNERKAQRLLQEMQILKKTKKLVLSKFSLANTEKSDDEGYINPEGGVFISSRGDLLHSG